MIVHSIRGLPPAHGWILWTRGRDRSSPANIASGSGSSFVIGHRGPWPPHVLQGVGGIKPHSVTAINSTADIDCISRRTDPGPTARDHSARHFARSAARNSNRPTFARSNRPIAACLNRSHRCPAWSGIPHANVDQTGREMRLELRLIRRSRPDILQKTLSLSRLSWTAEPKDLHNRCSYFRDLQLFAAFDGNNWCR